MNHHEIPIVALANSEPRTGGNSSHLLLENEIDGIQIEQRVIMGGNTLNDDQKAGHKTVYLFVKGAGKVVAAGKKYEVGSETILLPNAAETVILQAAENTELHYLKIVSKLTAQDQLEISAFPPENTQQVYCTKFSDCKSYREPIKSPNTVSRTILPNKYIPRVAMGTVHTQGPDEVGAHEHPMLEQLFLGLSKNNCVVYADDAKVDFPEHTLLHIPLGSRHSVSVAENKTMHYVWMDFFLDSKGEEWLKTHIED